MTLRFLALSAALAALSLSGCRPEEVDPVAPELGFVSINATEVESSTTPLTVTLSYRDHQGDLGWSCLLYTSPSPRDLSTSRMPSSA